MHDLLQKITDVNMWVIGGYIGQFLFFGSWWVQWRATEKARRNVIPLTFWYMRIVGSILLLACTIEKANFPPAIGFFFGMFFYSRNLYIGSKAQDAPPPAPAT